MIEVEHLTKRYGRVVAVDGLSFRVRPGAVTGFLGPNGAGKSTTLRLVLGLDTPTAGAARVNGRAYVDMPRPMREVGALLDANTAHGGRTAVDHLRWLARTNAVDRRRVDAVLEQVGLAAVGRKRVAGFSLGMRQRLGLAAALLGDPGVLILDEPINGLDPDGIRWFRERVRALAGEGRTVFVSSHVMSEMELTADRLIVIGAGRLIADTSVRELTDRFARGVLVRSPRATELTTALTSAGARVAAEPDDRLVVHGIEPRGIGDLAAAHGIAIWEIRARTASLEEAYVELTADSVAYRPTEAAR
ncbi:ATP-binding cassette domain-containing protein [Embleya sp. NBC_00896]|uniref:ABC transporter ATP-binding protein n=1 Tax=Embleya sp. NBC_00896 TaxID=2975961 RepID=UPI002F9178B9|nr:ATP-binding cassette domain-containing protein [Embleya sp. NBC_00896]